MDDSSVKISGPISFYLLETNGVKFYLLGDQHTSPRNNSCQQEYNIKCDSINYTYDNLNIRDSDCFSIGALLVEWFTYNNDHDISTDFFIEVPFTKSDKRNRISKNLEILNQRRQKSIQQITQDDNNNNIQSDQDDIHHLIFQNWLLDLELLFNDCLSYSAQNCKYIPNIRMHYMDVRLFSQSVSNITPDLFLFRPYHFAYKKLIDTINDEIKTFETSNLEQKFSNRINQFNNSIDTINNEIKTFETSNSEQKFSNRINQFNNSIDTIKNEIKTNTSEQKLRNRINQLTKEAKTYLILLNYLIDNGTQIFEEFYLNMNSLND